jgi:uncharacterized OB-fold protein
VTTESHDALLPVPDEVTKPWWDATIGRKLMIQCCEECGNCQHYPRALCIKCSSWSLGWIHAAGRGVIDSYTTVFRAPNPAFQAPYIIARVRLDEGPTLLTKIVGCAESMLSCGQPVSLDWEPLPDGHNLPVFRPINISDK